MLKKKEFHPLLANVMINARVGPLLKKGQYTSKELLLLYEDILNLAREEVKFFADMYESEKEVHTTSFCCE